MGWFLRMIGVGDAVATRLNESQLLWTRPVLLWIGLVLLVPAALYIVRRHRTALAHIEPVPRRWLSACRIGVLVVLVFVIGGPYLRLNEEVTSKPFLALVVDDSASMELPAGPFEAQEARELALAAGLIAPGDGAEGEAELSADVRRELNNLSRLDLALRVLLGGGDAWLAALRERFDVRLYRAARGVREMTGEYMANPVDEPGLREDTNLGAALEHVVDQAAGLDVAGVVILSDGRNTTGPDPLQVLRRFNGTETAPDAVTVPVWTVPVGSTTPPADIRILDIFCPSLITEGDHATVVATVQARGFAGRRIDVVLRDGDEVCDTKPLDLLEGDRSQVPLTYKAGKPGARLLTVEIDVQAEEQVAQNNHQSAFVDIDARRRKVLYLEGPARWDFRFLDHALRRDKGLEVAIILESMPPEPPATNAVAEPAVTNVAAAPPATNGTAVAATTNAAVAAAIAEVSELPQDAAGFAEYSVIMLGDVSPQVLTAHHQAQLLKAVEEEGVGLIVQAGPAHMPHAFAEGPLGARLPVRVSAAEGPAGLSAPGFAPFRMQVEAPGSVHPAFQLYDSASRNREVWNAMPPFYWAADVIGTPPGATVLAVFEHNREPLPLVAEHTVGRGRILFIGTDSTYRWRRNIGNHLFYRFWGQALRHAAGASERDGSHSWVEATPRRVEPGDPVSIELFGVDDDGAPLADSRVVVDIGSAGRSETATLKRTGVEGHYRGSWSPDRVGVYRVGFTDARGRRVSAFFRSAASGREFTRPDVNRDLLGNLADAAGGGLVELAQLHGLSDRLRGEVVTRDRTHEEELWDNWLVLLLLVGLYCTDVGIRRMLGLL